MGIQPDDLDSKQVARIVDLLSEGEIDGFPSARALSKTSTGYNVAALKDIFFNDTPLLASETVVGADTSLRDVSSALNFDFVNGTFEPRFGTQDQKHLSSIGVTNQRTVAVNVEIPKPDEPTEDNGLDRNDGTPVTRQITDTDVTSVRVVVGTPALQRAKKSGDVVGGYIGYKIEIQENGAGFSPISSFGIGQNGSPLAAGHFEIVGRTPDLFQAKHRIDFTPDTQFPVDIRITRNLQEYRSDDVITDTLNWYDYTERIGEKTRFPNSALAGFVIDAKQFPSIPRRSYRIRGVKVRIPHNATVDDETGRLTYTGTFNGTFKAAREWCTCPAMILLDLLTNTRYGLGNYVLTPEERVRDSAGTFEGTGADNVPQNIDVYAFRAASEHCGELVNGEPRFSCNVSLQSRKDAYDMIKDLCSVFRAMPFWETGMLSIAQDREEAYTYVFNQSNVTEEGFVYTGTSLKTRHTCVSVKYFDIARRDYVYELVEDSDAIEKYGYNKTSIEAFACTSRAQAHRLGKWLLYTEQNETEIVSFETDIAAGIMVRPGDRIKIGDPLKAGVTLSGRIASGSTTTAVKLDRSDVEMFGASAPSSFTLNVILPDGSLQIEENSTIVGNTVTPGSALDAAPVAGAPFSIGYTDVNLSTWRVMSVVENDNTYAINAVSYDSRKYAFVEEDVEFTPRDVTLLNEPPTAPTNIDVQEILYEAGGRVLQKLIIGWQASPRATEYRVKYALDGNSFTTAITTVNDFTIENTDVGTYTIQIVAIGYDQNLRKESLPAIATFDAIGKTAAPSNIASLNITPIDQHNAELHWPQSTDLDVRVGGTVEIRHAPHTDANAVWTKAQKIVPAVNGSSTRKIVPLKSGTYFIRAKDSVGNYSAATGIPSVEVELPEPQDLEVVQTYTENPSFTGTFDNTFNSVTEGGISLSGKGLIDDITDFDAVTNIDFFGGVESTGSYIFANTLDLSAKYDVELLADLELRNINPDDFWDSRTELIDTWTDIDADDFNETDAELYVRSTADDPSGTPTWSTWEPFVNSTKRGRAFQFKVELATDNTSQDPIVEALGVTVSLQRRTEQQSNISTGTSAKAITFPSAFYSTPSVTVTATDMATGDFFELTSISRTGFTIATKNSSGTIVSRTINYAATGHGKEIS
jgi:predicted phage tail protein